MLRDHPENKRPWFLPLLGVGVIGLVGLVVVLGRSGETPPSSSQPASQTAGQELSASPAKERPKAPRFTLKDYAGADVSLADFAGTPVVLNTWATWCPFCREELPDFAEVADEFTGQVVVIAINRGESRQTAKEYTDAFQVTNRITFLLDPTDAFYEAIGGISMPETLFLDREGRVRFHARGPVQKEEFRRQVDALVKEG
ncbi:TlpA family protein disulfide reductase [Candidatus Berkelbacteria bacterium]|nr:TlpA family protein disulfide reductase [Candidatus Berkelbacteria bacterium]